MQILLVEPYRPLARILHTGLVEAGFTVTVVDSLPAATCQLTSRQFDLILMDPPRQEELAVLQAWRHARLTTPVLVLSSPGGRTGNLDAFGLGPGTFVHKPFHFDDLLNEAHGLCDPSPVNLSRTSDRPIEAKD